MVFKNLWVLVLWTKVAPTLEGLLMMLLGDFRDREDDVLGLRSEYRQGISKIQFLTALKAKVIKKPWNCTKFINDLDNAYS